MRRATENWNRAYSEAPEIFDAFCTAEDPDGLVGSRLLAHAGLDGRSVLEIGCGTGRYTREWAPHAARYVGVERSPQMLALARKRCPPRPGRLEFVCANAERTPLADRSFDLAIAAWVVVNLRLPARERVLSEVSRLLRGGANGGLWLLENHWSGEFQHLRGRRQDVERARIQGLIDTHGFTLVETVETTLRFPSAAEAERVLGYLCGDAMRERLRCDPRVALSHNVVILHRPL